MTSWGDEVPAVEARQRRWRTLRVVGLALWCVVGVMVASVHHAVNELPLSDASVIREQAAAKHLDPALIAAVIYAETKFEPRTSSAGAEGLMQIEPETAEFLAKLSGGYSFTTSDLGTPKINVAYGSYYLRYLLDHYEGNEMLAIAAYNAGLANVDKWVAKARAEGRRADGRARSPSRRRARTCSACSKRRRNTARRTPGSSA